MLPVQLSHLGLGDKTSLVSRFVECFKTMWSNNGDLVSRTYTGTGAMEGGARVRRFRSVVVGRDGLSSFFKSVRYRYDTDDFW